MSINELREKKTALRQQICALLNAFEKETGVMIDAIRLERVDVSTHTSMASILLAEQRQDHLTKVEITLRGI